MSNRDVSGDGFVCSFWWPIFNVDAIFKKSEDIDVGVNFGIPVPSRCASLDAQIQVAIKFW